jgi:hypothetical protein
MSNNPLQDEEKVKCSAKTRRGTLCQTSPVTGKKRCRMHGGAKGSGAPKGSQNAFKHGRYSREFIENRRAATSRRREWMAFFREMGSEIRKTY